MRNIVPDNRCVHGITIGVRCVGCESGKCHHGFPLDRHCPTCATFHKPTPPKIDKDENLRKIHQIASQISDDPKRSIASLICDLAAIQMLAEGALKS